MDTQDSPSVGNRKRRTACGITCPSITYPILAREGTLSRLGVPHPGWGISHPDWGYPLLARLGGYPILTRLGGYPILARGHPILTWLGVPLMGYPSHCLGLGYPLARTGIPPSGTGVPPARMGTPQEGTWDQ